MRLIHWFIFVAGIAAAGFLIYTSRFQWSAPRIAGACLLVVSFAWIAVARIQLGRAFSLTAQARQLVTTGLYSRIRNPIYVASPFVVAGFALVVQQWQMLLFLAVIIPLQVIRARREADVLRNAFGAEYEEYRKRTWF